MKRTVWAALLLMSAVPGVHAAESLETDETQQKYERKALLQILDIGLKSRKAKLPASFCPYKAPVCIPLGVWDFKISQKLEDRASAEILERLAGNRYDKVKLKPDSLEISTLFEKIEVESDIGEFRFGTGKRKEFQAKVEEYLNEKVAPLMKELLIKAKDARYQEMDDKEKETFLATVAKEQSVPAEFLARLLNSAFVFSEYMPRPTGSVTIHEEHVKRNGRKVIEFSVGIDVNSTMNLIIHRFNAESGEFEHYRTIKASSGNVSGGATVYPFRPMDAFKVVSVFRNSFVVSAKAVALAVNTKLKKDDNFAIFATVDQIEDDYIASAIGEAEDLRIDAPYIIRQQIDGKTVETGWIKARSVAKQSLLKDAPGEYSSRFDLIGGDAEFKDQLREHPWTGVLGYIGMGTANQEVTEVDGLDASGGGDFVGLKLGAHMDLGYMFNSKSFTEGWLDLSVFFGGGGSALNTDAYGQYTSTSFLRGDINYIKRYHLGQNPLYMAYKLGFSVSAIYGSGHAAIDDITVSAGAFNAGLQLGYLFSPNVEFFVNADGFLPLVATYQIGTDGDDGDALMTSGYTINAGFSFHMKSIGGFASLMR